MKKIRSACVRGSSVCACACVCVCVCIEMSVVLLCW